MGVAFWQKLSSHNWGHLQSICKSPSAGYGVWWTSKGEHPQVYFSAAFWICCRINFVLQCQFPVVLYKLGIQLVYPCSNTEIPFLPAEWFGEYCANRSLCPNAVPRVSFHVHERQWSHFWQGQLLATFVPTVHMCSPHGLQGLRSSSRKLRGRRNLPNQVYIVRDMSHSVNVCRSPEIWKPNPSIFVFEHLPFTWQVDYLHILQIVVWKSWWREIL